LARRAPGFPAGVREDGVLPALGRLSAASSDLRGFISERLSIFFNGMIIVIVGSFLKCVSASKQCNGIHLKFQQ
jgi:hypothetical protein